MIRVRESRKRLLLLLTGLVVSGVILIGIFSTSKQNNQRIFPVNGRLDLQSWNLHRDIPLSLNGEWDFFWKKFITYQEIVNSNRTPDLKVKVPEVWNKYKFKGKSLPGFGYATYRLKVAGVSPGRTLALRVPNFSTAYRLYINQRLISANGKVSMDREHFLPEYRPKVVEFTPDDTSFELIVHVANFTYARGGFWYAIVLGTPKQIRNLDQTIEDKDLFLFGGLLVLVLYYLSIFLLRRGDKSSLYFTLMCLMFGSRTVIYGNFLIYKLFPPISFRAIVVIGYITVCWFAVFCVYLIKELFPREISGKFLYAITIFAVIMTPLFLLTPISFFTSLVYILQTVAMLTGIYATICAGVAFVRGRKDSLLVLTGALITTVGALHDTFYQNSMIISKYGELSSIGLFIMMFLQSFILARRFSKAFRDVEALSQKLLKLDKMKDEFMANTSHELRTPLSGILGITEALLRGSEGELNNGQKQNLWMISASSRRLANLVNDILDYSKLKHGDIRLNLKPIPLYGLIQTVVNIFQQLRRSTECTIISDLPAQLPPALADENRVVQILYNLIGNAVKFTNAGHVKVSARVVGDKLEVCVSDTGVGIAPDKLEDIFKSFEQVDTSLTRKHGGTGLGLSITKQLVELQGGKIWVTSIPGSGSQFYFTLPIAPELPAGQEPVIDLPELDISIHEEQPLPMKQTGSGLHILLVDDDPVNRQSAAAILKFGGYTVVTVNHGKAALEEIQRFHDYSLLILDVMMPEMSGYEVCRRLREHKSLFDLPVLMLTAKTATEDILMGLEAGANDYLPKPFEPDELLARVRTLVSLKISVDKSITAELNALQAQIKPHFLLNTLNTVIYFCRTNPSKAVELLTELGSYLRSCFHFKGADEWVSLEKELEIVKSYLAIAHARYNEIITIVYDIEENLDCRIPSFTLQPLVENALKHGILPKNLGGTIEISARKEKGLLILSVCDDGLGMTENKINDILNPSQKQGGVGINNVNRRLKSIYGRSLEIKSHPGAGTTITLKIPLEEDANSIKSH
ncbi:MAG TPA: ATP-binding protein [Bacillota bacterium]|nr:ATP-binding protein [Bacillota bacterium]